MTDQKQGTFEWRPMLTTEFRTIEVRNSGEDDNEEMIRAMAVQKQEQRELAAEIGLDMGEDTYELDDPETKLDPEKRLLEQFEYRQAFQDGDKWSVQTVTTTVLQSGKEIQESSISAADRNLTALEAVSKLTAFEGMVLSYPESYEISYDGFGTGTVEKAREELGSRHFITAGEREGLLFDTLLNPHNRINKHVLPSGGKFPKEDISRANQRWDEGKELTENFNASAISISGEMSAGIPAVATIDRVLRSISGLAIIDRFVEKIESSTKHLSQYIDRYDNPNSDGQGHLIEAATDALTNKNTGALAILEELKSEGIMRDTTEWTNFAKEAHVACYVIHAQAMLNLLKEKRVTDPEECNNIRKSLSQIGGTSDDNGNTIKKGDMEKLANKYGLSEKTIANYKRAMGYSGRPKMPELLTGYLGRFEERKKVFAELSDGGTIPNIETVIPPTHKITLGGFGRLFGR